MKNITLSEVVKKDLRLLGFLLLNGLVAFFSIKIKADEALSLVLGGAVNYVAYRVSQELSNQGYKEALRK